MGPATRIIDKLKIDNTRVVTAAGAITMANEGVLIVNKTVGAATAVTLQAAPEAGHFLFIKDGKGDAGTNNITITPAAGNVDGAATYVISENYGSVTLVYNGTEWGSVATSNPLSSTELGFLNGVTAGTAAASKALVLDANSAITTGLTSLTVTTLTATNATLTTPTVTGITTWSDVASINAAGSVIGNATAIANAISVVAGADDTKGVVLPTAVAGKTLLVYSSQATNGLKVYPPVNGTVNGGTANTAIVIEGKTMALFVGTSATNWASMFTVNA